MSLPGVRASLENLKKVRYNNRMQATQGKSASDYSSIFLIFSSLYDKISMTKLTLYIISNRVIRKTVSSYLSNPNP